MARSPFYRIHFKDSQRDISNMVKSFTYEECLDEDDYVKLPLGNVTKELVDEDDFSRIRINTRCGCFIGFTIGILFVLWTK